MTYALSVLNLCNSFVQWTDWNLRPCSLIVFCWAVNFCKRSHLDEFKNWVNLIHEQIVHTCFVNLFREWIVNLLDVTSYMNFHGLEELTFFHFWLNILGEFTNLIFFHYLEFLTICSLHAVTFINIAKISVATGVLWIFSSNLGGAWLWALPVSLSFSVLLPWIVWLTVQTKSVIWIPAV